MPTMTVFLEGRRIQAPAGARVSELLSRLDQAPSHPAGALVNQRLVGLTHEVTDGAAVQVVTRDDPHGLHVVRRSAGLLLFAALRKVAPALCVRAGQTLADWLYFEIDCLDGDLPALLAEVEAAMQEMVNNDEPFDLFRTSTERAQEVFHAEGREERVDLLRTWWHESVKLVRIDGYTDLALGPTLPTAGYLGPIALRSYGKGFVLGVVSGQLDVEGLARPLPPMPGLLAVYEETRDWNRVLGVSTIADLNRVCLTNDYREVIKVAEGFHEKKIAAVADRIGDRRDQARLVLVAGPSSSGKTTFTKRLAVQLQVIGLNPVALSVDDYYIDREHTPLDEEGKPDFEALEAVDLGLFNEHLGRLLDGEEVHTPRYDFMSGRRAPEDRWQTLRLRPGDMLIVEGIHALNPRLTSAVPTDRKFRIYVSALTQLSIDAHNRISTSDTRLLRRLVRDRVFRGHSSAATLNAWASVRRGELRHIFPFQETADVMINSALVYEIAVFKVFAQRYLLEVPPGDPAFPEAYRLLKFLELFVPIFPDRVPQNSIVREFIGGSSFHY